MGLQQLALVGVEGFVLTIRIPPPVGQSRRDLAGKKSAEQCVARVRCRRRQHREVMRCLDIEERSEQRLQRAPLVETQAIDDDEHRRLVALEDRQQEFANDVDGERRPVTVQILEPLRIILLHVGRELAVHVGIESLERFVEAHLAGGGEIDIPAHQLVEAIDPAPPIEIAVAIQLDGAESFDEAARDCLLADARAFQDPRHHRQHLARVDRLDEIITDVGADGFLERRVFLALGHHHHRQRRGELAHIAENFEAALARHLLVEQQDVERAAPEQLDRVVCVRGPLYGIAFGAEKDAVRLEKLTFIVHPEYGFGGAKDRCGHKSECSRGQSPCLDSEGARSATSFRTRYTRLSVPRANGGGGAGSTGRRPGDADRLSATRQTVRGNTSALRAVARAHAGADRIHQAMAVVAGGAERNSIDRIRNFWRTDRTRSRSLRAGVRGSCQSRVCAVR